MNLTIALPKGRLGDESIGLFLKSKIINEDLPKDSRKLIFEVGNNIKLVQVRAWDVPAYVEMGTADIGVCGKDDLIEHNADIFELEDLKFGYCKMCLAAKNDIDENTLFKNSYVRVATKYPEIAKKYFKAKGIQAEIIKLYGSIELAAISGLSDCIIDIVSTGATLKENGLHIVEVIFESTARLIANRASFYKKNKIIKEVKNSLMKNLS